MKAKTSESMILCISVASNPGRFGVTVHNAGYRALGIDYVYQACATNDIAGAMRGVRALGIRGCSVSMPFKETVIEHLDALDPLAATIKAVNTVVNNQRKLIGYNTDIVGVRESLLPFLKENLKSALILGVGGAARSVIQALLELNLKNIIVCGRQQTVSESLVKQFNISAYAWDKRNEITADILINATPIGMSAFAENILPLDKVAINKFKLIVDMVASPPITPLIKCAQEMNIDCINGSTVALHQAYAQFKLYTGLEPPREAMYQAATQLFKELK